MAFRAKLTFFYEADRAGFSETWYTNDADHASAMVSAKAYLALRKELLGFGGVCVGVRVSDDTVQRDALLYIPQNKAAMSSIFQNTTDIVDKTGMALLTRVEGGPAHRRLWALRGCPDTVFVASELNGIDLGTGILSPFQKLSTFLKAGKFQIRVLAGAGPPPTYSLVAITSCEIERASYRKPGRLFFQVPGRRLA